ncbi:MAG: alpha-1,2-fucosyltransferase [Turneriella sp.]|nr:alpha-1,2-fucosyltransferase [Turneriella sp.]
MIIVQLKGLLGNQMHQYALGKVLAMKNHTQLKIDPVNFLNDATKRNYLRPFIPDLREITAADQKLFFSRSLLSRIKRKTLRKKITIVNEAQNIEFKDYVLQLNGDIYLNGYWQSEKYLSQFEREIRQEFSVKIKPDKPNAELAVDIAKSNSVSIHFRRGDFVSNPEVNKLFGVLGFDYYKKSIDLITSRIHSPKFYVFSNEPEWVRKNFKIDYPTVYVDLNPEENRNYEDMRLMSLCKHNIIANSSFSWWAAWLNTNFEKIVIAPKIWFSAEPNLDTSDLVPNAWLRI